MKALIIITKNYHEDPHAYEVPDVYTIEVDSVMDNNKTAKSRAEDIMTQLYKNYFEAEDMESAIPLDHKLSHYDRHHLYGQIVWVNGDIHQYYLVIDPPDAADELKKYHRHQKKWKGANGRGYAGRSLRMMAICHRKPVPKHTRTKGMIHQWAAAS